METRILHYFISYLIQTNNEIALICTANSSLGTATKQGKAIIYEKLSNKRILVMIINFSLPSENRFFGSVLWRIEKTITYCIKNHSTIIFLNLLDKDIPLIITNPYQAKADSLVAMVFGELNK